MRDSSAKTRAGSVGKRARSTTKRPANRARSASPKRKAAKKPARPASVKRPAARSSTTREYVGLALERTKAKPIQWSSAQPLLSLSLAKHPDPRARALKGIEIRAGTKDAWDWRVRAAPVRQSYLVLFDGEEEINSKPGAKTPAMQYPIKVLPGKRTDSAGDAAVADKMGGYPFFMQHDMWQGARDPSKLVNLLTWKSERPAGKATLWAGDFSVLNAWLGPGRGLHVDVAMG